MLLTIRSPASATCSTSARDPMTNAAPPARRPASAYCSAAPHGDHLVQRRLEAQAPQLAHEVLRRGPHVVGEEHDLLAGLAQRGNRLRGALGRLVADPDAAVEVEEDVVVAADLGAQRHAGNRISTLARAEPAALSSPAMPGPSRRRLALAVPLCALALAACGGGSSSGEGGDGTPAPAAANPGCERVAAPKPRAEGDLPRPTARLKAGGDHRREGRDVVRRVRDHARRQARAAHRRLVRLAGPRGLLRRPRLPPRGRRVRDPGGRPARHRRGRPRLHDRARRRRATSPTARASWRWPRPRPSRPGRRAASSSSSPPTTPSCRPTTRCSAGVTRGMDVVERIGAVETDAGDVPVSPVVIRSIRIETEPAG